jgi:hypothetical protein
MTIKAKLTKENRSVSLYQNKKLLIAHSIPPKKDNAKNEMK